MKAFGDTARGLARNPLGIIALFITLIYGLASLVVAFSGNLEASDRVPIVWFLVLFPIAVLTVFAWLVSSHHTKLYAPTDFSDEKNFVASRTQELRELKSVAHEEAPSLIEDASNASLDEPTGRAKHRDDQYGKSRGFFLVHQFAPLKEKGDQYDFFIYLKRHKSADFSDIKDSEFFLGRYWGNKIIRGEKVGKIIGIRTSAYGPFLCTCRLTFQDGSQVMLERYIDFEMAPLVRDS